MTAGGRRPSRRDRVSRSCPHTFASAVAQGRRPSSHPKGKAKRRKKNPKTILINGIIKAHPRCSMHENLHGRNILYLNNDRHDHTFPTATPAALREDFEIEEYLEMRQFPLFHKIILGIHSQTSYDATTISLERHLELHLRSRRRKLPRPHRPLLGRHPRRLDQSQDAPIPRRGQQPHRLQR